MIVFLLAQAGGRVTWIRVDKPSIDLLGLILGSILATGLLVGVALGLGVVLGIALIRYRRRQNVAAADPFIRLHLPPPSRGS